MLSRLCVLCWIAALAGCGGGDFVCDIEKRRGTYDLTAKKVSGSCPEIGRGVVMLGGGPAAGPCRAVDQRISADGCTITTLSRCETEEEIVDISVATTQEDAGASRLSGVATVAAHNRGGASCVSTYDLDYVRKQR